jgi:hypothetical protein
MDKQHPNRVCGRGLHLDESSIDFWLIVFVEADDMSAGNNCIKKKVGRI